MNMQQKPPVPLGGMNQGQQPGANPTPPPAQGQAPGQQPGANPTPPLAQGQAQNQNPPEPPDVSAQFRGWYPRWWLLSAIFCYLLLGAVMVLQPLICLNSLSTAVVCQFSTWTGGRQMVVVITIWGIFLIGWVISHILGVIYIERTQGKRTALAKTLRSMSEFNVVYPPLYIYGMLAFLTILIMWISNRFQSVLFALASITVFVVNSCYMYTRNAEDRRMSMLGYVVLAIIGIAFLILFGLQPVIFSSMIVVIAVSLVVFFRTRPSQSATPTQSAAQQLRAQNAASITVGHIIKSLGRAILGRKP